MARPRTILDDRAVVEAYNAGGTLSDIARSQGVDRYVIRRIVTENGCLEPATDGTVLAFPTSYRPEIPEGHLISRDFAEATGITFRTFDYWCRTGLLHPTVVVSPEGGTTRTFAPVEVQVALLMVALLEAGMNIRPAGDLARRLVLDRSAEFAGWTLELEPDIAGGGL